MTEEEIRANPKLSHRLARVSSIMVSKLGMTQPEMYQLFKLVHRVKSYEDLPEHFRVKVEEAEKIAEELMERFD
jgi:hypothetical protein